MNIVDDHIKIMQDKNLNSSNSSNVLKKKKNTDDGFSFRTSM